MTDLITFNPDDIKRKTHNWVSTNSKLKNQQYTVLKYNALPKGVHAKIYNLETLEKGIKETNKILDNMRKKHQDKNKAATREEYRQAQGLKKGSLFRQGLRNMINGGSLYGIGYNNKLYAFTHAGLSQLQRDRQSRFSGDYRRNNPNTSFGFDKPEARTTSFGKRNDVNDALDNWINKVKSKLTARYLGVKKIAAKFIFSSKAALAAFKENMKQAETKPVMFQKNKPEDSSKYVNPGKLKNAILSHAYSAVKVDQSQKPVLFKENKPKEKKSAYIANPTYGEKPVTFKSQTTQAQAQAKTAPNNNVQTTKPVQETKVQTTKPKQNEETVETNPDSLTSLFGDISKNGPAVSADDLNDTADSNNGEPVGEQNDQDDAPEKAPETPDDTPDVPDDNEPVILDDTLYGDEEVSGPDTMDDPVEDEDGNFINAADPEAANLDDDDIYGDDPVFDEDGNPLPPKEDLEETDAPKQETPKPKGNDLDPDTLKELNRNLKLVEQKYHLKGKLDNSAKGDWTAIKFRPETSNPNTDLLNVMLNVPTQDLKEILESENTNVKDKKKINSNFLKEVATSIENTMADNDLKSPTVENLMALRAKDHTKAPITQKVLDSANKTLSYSLNTIAKYNFNLTNQLNIDHQKFLRNAKENYLTDPSVSDETIVEEHYSSRSKSPVRTTKGEITGHINTMLGLNFKGFDGLYPKDKQRVKDELGKEIRKDFLETGRIDMNKQILKYSKGNVIQKQIDLYKKALNMDQNNVIRMNTLKKMNRFDANRQNTIALQTVDDKARVFTYTIGDLNNFVGSIVKNANLNKYLNNDQLTKCNQVIFNEMINTTLNSKGAKSGVDYIIDKYENGDNALENINKLATNVKGKPVAVDHLGVNDDEEDTLADEVAQEQQMGMQVE